MGTSRSSLTLCAMILMLTSCVPVNTVRTEYLMGGQKDTNMAITPCWVSPPGSDLWYPCDSESVKDKECLNVMELAMKSVEADIKKDNRPSENTIRLWNRAKQLCWSENRNDPAQKHYH